MRDPSNRSGGCLLEAAPRGDSVLGGIDVIPVHQAMYGRVVELVIEHRSSIVLDGVLHGGDEDDDNQGNGQQARVGCAKDGEDLEAPSIIRFHTTAVAAACRRVPSGAHREDDDEEKVDIGDILELKPQILRNEAEGRILGRADLVPLELGAGPAMLIPGIGWQGNVEEDPSPHVRGLAAVLVGLGSFGRHRGAVDRLRPARFPLLRARGGPPVETVDDLVALASSAVARLSLRRPSDALDRRGHMAVDFLWLCHDGFDQELTGPAAGGYRNESVEIGRAKLRTDFTVSTQRSCVCVSVCGRGSESAPAIPVRTSLFTGADLGGVDDTEHQRTAASGPKDGSREPNAAGKLIPEPSNS